MFVKNAKGHLILVLYKYNKFFMKFTKTIENIMEPEFFKFLTFLLEAMILLC